MPLKTIWVKKLPKTSLSYFCVIHLILLCVILGSKCDLYTQWATTEESNFSFVSNCPLEIASESGMGAYVYFPSQNWDSICLTLMQYWCMLPQSQWIHRCISNAMLKRICSHCVFYSNRILISINSYSLYASTSRRIHKTHPLSWEGKYLMETSHL